MSSAAEQALKKKFALLRKKQASATGGGAAPGGSGEPRGAPVAASGAAQDPARLAAIRALQASRAAAGERKNAAAALPPRAPPAAAAEGKPVTKVRLVIPKRDMSGAPPAAPAQPAKPAAPVDPARAAALAALRARQQAQRQQACAAPAAASQQQQQQQQPQGEAAAALKRPSVPKRPSARPRPQPQQQQQQQQAIPDQQQHEQYNAGGAGQYGADMQGGDDGAAAKRQRLDDAGEFGEQEEAGNTTLFVGDLPAYWATPDLLEFFNSQFGAVAEARVIGTNCYGFVTFAEAQDAEAVLEFAQQQGIWAENERMLRINWAQGGAMDGKKGGCGEGGGEAYEHPVVSSARLQAQELVAQVDAAQIKALAMEAPPERQLVSYEDL